MGIAIPLVQAVFGPAKSGYLLSYWRTTGARVAHQHGVQLGGCAVVTTSSAHCSVGHESFFASASILDSVDASPFIAAIASPPN
jgi:hypothetical protein